MYRSCDMLLIWFRHQRQPGPTKITEGACVLSAFGSAYSVDSTWFQLEAWYWFNPRVLSAFKLKHGNLKIPYLPTPTKKGKRGKKSKTAEERWKKNRHIWQSAKQWYKHTSKRTTVLLYTERRIHTTTERCRNPGPTFHSTNPVHS
jgi:hypothetical protein